MLGPCPFPLSQADWGIQGLVWPCGRLCPIPIPIPTRPCSALLTFSSQALPEGFSPPSSPSPHPLGSRSPFLCHPSRKQVLTYTPATPTPAATPQRPHLDHQVHKALVIIARHRGVGPNDQVAIDPSREVDVLACKTGNGHLRSDTIPLGAYLPRVYTWLTFKLWSSLGSHCSLPLRDSQCTSARVSTPMPVPMSRIQAHAARPDTDPPSHS